MPNELVTPAEFAQAFRDTSRKQVASMNTKTVRKFAAMRSVRPGINGAIIAHLALAARERLKSEADCKSS